MKSNGNGHGPRWESKAPAAAGGSARGRESRGFMLGGGARVIEGLLKLFLAAMGKVLQEEYQWSVRESGRMAKLVVDEMKRMWGER